MRVQAAAVREYLLIAAVVCCCVVLPARAQRVQPVIAELAGSTQSYVELVNNSMYPLVAVLEPRSFSLSETGRPIFRPLDREIQLRLSSMSVRIPPQQSRVVYYEVKAETLPAWFVIYCQFTGLPSHHGVNVQIDLPHTVYLQQKEKLKASDLSVRLLSFDPQEKRGVAEVENNSQKLGRVESAQAIGSNTKLALGGFPLFPGGRRRVEFTWSKLPPQKFVIQGKGFTVEEELPAASE